MADRFETRSWDGAGRVGELAVPGRDPVTTPALLPVVNPGRLTVDPARFTEFGAEALITNAYIIHGDEDLRERAEDEGLHEMLGFDGTIMCDSGAFQLAEYGEIDVTSAEILAFQRSIGADIGTPIDLPTPPEADRERAERELETTRERLAAAAETCEDRTAGGDREMLLSGPVQGATYPDLRERAGRELREIGFDLYPVGAVVPLLNAYRYDDVVRATLAAKRGLGPDAPVHLFGAGHPMVFALAAAAGCDLFDSAAYAIYARDGRYLTPRGTRQLADLEAFPCGCPICTEHSPEGLRRRADDETERLLAEHNLHASFAELRRVRQAIREGSLLELVETRARGHPRLLDGYRALLDGAAQLEATDPAAKSTFFYTSPESARRPEVERHHERIDRFADRAPATLLLVEPPATADAPGVAFGGDGPLPGGSGSRGTADERREGRGGAIAEDEGEATPAAADADGERVAGDTAEGAGAAVGETPGAVSLADAGDGPVGQAVHEASAALAADDAADPDAVEAVWLLRPPFGPVPPALAGTYPLSAELPSRMDAAGQTAAADGLARLAARSGASLVVAHRDWSPAALDALPDGTTAVDLTAAPVWEGSP